MRIYKIFGKKLWIHLINSSKIRAKQKDFCRGMETNLLYVRRCVVWAPVTAITLLTRVPAAEKALPSSTSQEKIRQKENVRPPPHNGASNPGRPALSPLHRPHLPSPLYRNSTPFLLPYPLGDFLQYLNHGQTEHVATTCVHMALSAQEFDSQSLINKRKVEG